MIEPDEPGAVPQQPKAADAAAAGQLDPNAPDSLLALAFLIAPFFLWGTTMAAMRVRACACVLCLGGRVYRSGCQQSLQ